MSSYLQDGATQGQIDHWLDGYEPVCRCVYVESTDSMDCEDCPIHGDG